MWLLKHGLAERLERARREQKYTTEDELRFRELRRHAYHGPALADAEDDQELPELGVQSARLPRIAVTAGNSMQISIEGILTKKPDFLVWFFYGANTAYRDIQSALAIAEQDSSIKTVVLDIDSPGGHVDGLFELLANLQSFTKKMEVRASLAASAAYAIAAVAPGKITATNIAAAFGSIGVAAQYFVDDAIVDIASTEAPKKRPDLRTEEGKAAVREELDAIHALFVDAIATGRGTTVADVNQNFGRGGVLLADEAKQRGMIDAIAKPPKAAPRKASADTEVGSKHMNTQELKEQHPDLYAAVLQEGRSAGVEEGRAAGEAAERKRVLAHLKLADTTGATKVARDAIESGASTMDEGVFAEYQAAALNRSAIRDRQQETDKAAGAVNGAATTEDGRDLGDQVADLLAQRRGKKKTS
jgi:ClpP class serine protease